MTLEDALAHREIPAAVKDQLTLVTVPYVSFDGESMSGELVLHKEIAADAAYLFITLSELKFPIQKIIPIVAYNWDDDASMADNNTSAFNYRVIRGTDRLSNHSYGRAIDINPMQNPYTARGGSVVPPGAQYNPDTPGTITPDIAVLFISRGWEWGGEWEQHKDWQHFEKLA